MYVPKAFVQPAQFAEAVARATKHLGQQVLSVTPTLGSNWNGEPAVFFLVVLSDEASRRDQLRNVTHQTSRRIIEQVQPLEQWEVLPYFNFRSASEQARINQHSLAY
ncbi:MAG: hypothetical protein ABSF98_17590 [Bryobacteraceae bacterium]